MTATWRAWWWCEPPRSSRIKSRPLLLFFPFSGPAVFIHLAGASQRQGFGRHGIGDHGAGADVAAVANIERRYQRGIAADKGALTDVSFVFTHAIVVAG